MILKLDGMSPADWANVAMVALAIAGLDDDELAAARAAMAERNTFDEATGAFVDSAEEMIQ